MQQLDKCSCKDPYGICQIHWRPRPELRLLPEILCERTDNQVGTDCWAIGHPCACPPCTAFVQLLNDPKWKSDR